MSYYQTNNILVNKPLSFIDIVHSATRKLSVIIIIITIIFIIVIYNIIITKFCVYIKTVFT